jgi:hypothetical protein
LTGDALFIRITYIKSALETSTKGLEFQR